MKNVTWTRVALVVMASFCLALPALAVPPSIAVVQPGLNGTGNALEVTFPTPLTGGEAAVISQHPVNEQTFNVSYFIDHDDVSLCAGVNCRVAHFRAFGNREGFSREHLRYYLRRLNNGSYTAFVWYKDLNSTNPGFWEQAPLFFFPGSGDPLKIGFEWTGASAAGADDGELRIFRNDVETAVVNGIDSPFEVDNARIGHAGNAVAAGANGTYTLDEYVSTR